MPETNPNRRFLVARQGNEVVIREVTPDTSAHEFTRADAWMMAQVLSRPNRSRRIPAAPVFFQGLDGMRTQVRSADEASRQRVPTTQSSAPASGLRPSVTATRTTVAPDHVAAAQSAAAARNGYGRQGTLNARPTERVRYEPAPTEPTELEQVVADLREGRAAGRLNEFGASLLEQFERSGRLTDPQIAAGMRGIRAKEARRQERQAQPTQEPLPVVRTGRYAVDSAEGELRFYRVARADSGRTFIHIQFGPNEGEVPFSWAGYRTILQSIVDAGEYDAAVRYGREIGACSRCGTRLTNRLSRELGIGPICGGHWHEHDEWLVIRGAAREAIRDRGENPDEEMDR